jgi:hypothetical protein
MNVTYDYDLENNNDEEALIDVSDDRILRTRTYFRARNFTWLIAPVI